MEKKCTFTQAQKERLREMGSGKEMLSTTFSTPEERQTYFHKIEKTLAKENKVKLEKLLEETHRVSLCELSETLAKALMTEGFTQVATPSIVSAKDLERMTITPENPLYQQVFWLERGKKALRPMLAPNLYTVSRSLMQMHGLPLKVFEIGSCFRKESEGSAHLKEFTMLNLVEWGTPEEERIARLKTYAKTVLEATDIHDYRFEEEDSTVYGLGLDVVSKEGLELASTSMGPHPLDGAWKIHCTWIGIGFGLERLLMHQRKEEGIHRYSRSNVYMDGACLKVR